MALKLALLSGKGGSGKTTIALSLAKMLSECGLKTMLIDCDIATNGATYFFEAKLERTKNYLSLLNLFSSFYERPAEKMLSVDNNFWFVPSNSLFSNNRAPFPLQGCGLFTKNINICEKGFDVMIFDCQAGYSKLLDIILEMSTTNLIVLEPDAISSSSVRVLYAQVSNLIEKTKTYQIFNKITEEEYSVYKQVNVGTFTSLPPIKFNWEVRKAFVFSKIPEMGSTNVEFGNDVFTVANFLFPAFEDSLSVYTHRILLQEKEEAEFTLQELKYVRHKIYQNSTVFFRKRTFSMFMIIGGMATVAGASFFATYTEFFVKFLDFKLVQVLVFVLGVGVILSTLWTEWLWNQRAKRAELRENSRKYENLLKRISQIDKVISQSESKKIPYNQK